MKDILAKLKAHWKICAAVLLALVVVTTAIVWIAVASNQPEDTTPEVTTPTDPPITPETFEQILAVDIAKYNIICAQRSSAAVMGQFWQLQSQIDKMYGKELVAETDYLETAEFEILIGNTNREESQAFLSNLLWDDYGYAIVGDKIVIAGHTAEGTLNAMKHFLEHLKSGDHTNIFFSNKDQYLFRYPYVSDTFLFNGIDVSNAKIVVNEKLEVFKNLATALADKSLEICGRRPEIVTDAEVASGDSLIIIGASKHIPVDMESEWNVAQESRDGKFSYYVNNTDSTVWINAVILEGYSAINREILPQIQSNKAASLSVSTGLFKVPQIFSVMSFNVYVGAFNDARVGRVVDTILENAPSAFGVQEASVVWMTALKNKLGDIYTSVGVGRDLGGLGEHTAIFYRTDMFELIESGTKWLSSTPDKEGSKLTYANFPRIMTYVVLERKTDGVRFLYVNTHLDHDGNNTREVAEGVRQQQIEILIDEIKKLGDLPTIVTGDFNVTPEASAYQTMIANGFLDASRVAKEGEVKSTYNGMDDSYTGAIIDYIFVSPDLGGAVNTYTVCPAKRDGGWVSDHNAIIATITLPVPETQE